MKTQPGAVPISHPHVIFGGSYYKTTALLDCMDRVLPQVDWHEVYAKDRRIPVNWDTVPPVLFALGGYVSIPWDAICEKERRYVQRTGKNCSEAVMRHKGNPASENYDRRTLMNNLFRT